MEKYMTSHILTTQHDDVEVLQFYFYKKHGNLCIGLLL